MLAWHWFSRSGVFDRKIFDLCFVSDASRKYTTEVERRMRALSRVEAIGMSGTFCAFNHMGQFFCLKVLAMTMAEPGSRVSLRFKLEGNKGDLGR